MAEPFDTPHDPYAALRFPGFRRLAAGNFIASLGEMIVAVAIAWELYERTGSAFALGLVGLVQVLPVIGLALFTGQVADRVSRKRLLLATQALLMLCSLGLTLLSATQGSLVLVYFILLLTGVARAFHGPANSALLPHTIAPHALANAATWSSSSWQLATVVGPALGGFLIAQFESAAPVYALDVVASLLYVLLILGVREPKIQQTDAEKTITRESLLAGVRFIRRTPVILAAITLDMFAVLFGGATALLPVFARDILQVGPEGLGWMRAAPSIGAVLMVLMIAYLPPFQRAGKVLLLAVAGFGVATIVFGLSTSFPLSLAMLVLLGALDNISVVIRSTLFLTRTPDAMRGRVSAINGMFIGISNEVGAFESGVVAGLFGPVFAVVSGGIGTIIVVTLVALKWPQMRRLGALNESVPQAVETA